MDKEQMARESALKDVKLYMANDWEIKEETPEYFLLKRNTASTGTHILLALFFWWLLFIPNIIYHINSSKTKRIVK